MIDSLMLGRGVRGTRGHGPFAIEAMLGGDEPQVFRRLAPADGDRLLELGCGVGAPARALIAGIRWR